MKNKLKALSEKLNKDNSLRVKRSYYTFSREYPAGNIPIKRRRNRKLHTRLLRLLPLLAVFVLMAGLSYFVITLALEISYKQPSEKDQTAQVGESLLVREGVQSLYMPWDKLGDKDYIRRFIREVKRKDCNSVVITFKTAEGKLNYTSLLDYAVIGKCSVFDNGTVREAVDMLEQEDIAVIAQLYCFRDSTVPVTSGELAVKYMDTDINWTDSKTGEPYLNPCSTEVHAYLTGIISELYALDIKGFLLEDCCFPDSENSSNASYPGLSDFDSENAALKSLIDSAKKSLPSDCFFLFGYSTSAALEGSTELYHGPMADAPYDGYTVWLNTREESYQPDKKTGFSSMLSLFSLIEQANPDKSFVPVIDMSEYSSKYLRTVKKNGYTDFILFDEQGEY